jgi:Ca2+-dependent lipid-binding protein
LHLIVHSAKELPGRKTWSPFVEIEVDSALSGEAHRKKLESEYDFYHKRTVTKKHTNTPTWEQNFEFILADVNNDEIKIRVRDSKEDQDLGHISGKIADFVKTGTAWYTMEGVETGRIYVTFLYNPVSIPGGIVPSGEIIYVPAIGVARITVQKATNIEDLLMKQDYYVTVTSNDALVGKTRKAKADKGIQGEIAYQETFDVLVRTTDDDIQAALFNENNLMNDEEVGKGKIKLSEPFSVFANTIDLGKERNLAVSSTFLPISEPPKDQPKVKLQPGAMMLSQEFTGNCGILKIDSIVVEGVTAKSIISTEKKIKLLPELYITPMTIVKLASGTSRDGTFKWKEPIELFIADTVKDQFHIVLMEEKELGGTECLVSIRVPIKQLKAKAWYQLFDDEGKIKEKARIYFDGEFRPIPTKIPGRPDDQGTLNLEIKSASNLKAVDAGGTSDPYVQVLLNDKKLM